MAVKDLRLVLDMAKDNETPMPLALLVKELFTATAQMGLRELDTMAIAIEYGKMADAKISKLVNQNPLSQQ